ncbi:hypothetical protein ACN95_03215 [Gordonia sihwensis]|nr:hypothetical protein [Gordonia sihwensis]
MTHDLYVPRSDLAAMLRISGPSVDALIDSGVITGAIQVGRTRAVPADVADRLLAIPLVDKHPPILIVKVQAMRPDESDPRPWQGWNPAVAGDDPDQLEAVRKYWRVANPDNYLGERMAVTTAGFIHAIYRINGYRTHPGNLRAFDIELDTSDEAKELMQQRFSPKSGGTVELR